MIWGSVDIKIPSYSPKMTILILSLIFQMCNPDCPREFEIPVYLSPPKPIYRFGDTIELYSKFSKYLREINQNEYYNFEKTQILGTIQCFKLDTINQSRRSVIGKNIGYYIDDSIYLKLRHSNFGDGDLILGDFNYKNDTFYTMAKLVIQDPGIYCIWFNCLNFEQKFPGQCKFNAIYDIHTKMNGGGKNNVDFLREATDSFYINWMLADSIARFHNFGGYCFKVMP